MEDVIKLLIINHPMFSKYDNHTEDSSSHYEWEKCNSDYAFLSKLNLSLFLVMQSKGYDDEDAHKAVLEANQITKEN